MPHPPLIESMLQADFYPHPTADIRLLQTHISWVILSGPFAYKIKKPVNFGFLDFSTLAKRQHFCEEELRLNRRLSPQLYLDVLAIGGEHHTAQLGATEGIVEYCIKMKQFGDDALLANHLNQGSIHAAWMDDLATDIAAFHRTAEQTETISAFGEPDYLMQHITSSLDSAASHPDSIEPTLIEDIEQRAAERIRALREVFAQRITQGHIRDCHGDLHPGNIALHQGRPMIFDCIEFSLEYRAIDTLSDAAFLAMDLDAHGRADLAFRFLSRYLEHSGDYEAMPLLALFLSYRAAVRGKVACLLAEDASISEAVKSSKLAEAAHYFTFASAYLSKPAQPACLHIVGGLSGSGKSHLSLLGCGLERAIIIRSDATRKRIAPQHPVLPLYGDAMHRLTYQAMFDAAAVLLKTDWPVILDATFLNPEERQNARELAAANNTPCRFIWLDVPEEKLRHNIRQRGLQGRDISDADITVLEGQLADYHRPDEQDILHLTSAATWPQQ